MTEPARQRRIACTMVSSERVKQVFGEAHELPAGDRAAFLDTACAEDTELRTEVEALLAAFDAAEEFLVSEESPAPKDGIRSVNDLPARVIDPATEDSRLLEGPGTIIGRYKLLQEIGHGGFGTVFMAEQREPLVRKVALKVIKLGMDTRQVIARFQVERQALAMMDHPNIARVLDAGATDSGRSYFVMELVRGVPITTYCDENNLSPRGRLKLFSDVCNAVQHAHQKGIIHCDIKPSNVLVSRYDDKPVVKIIDFGIAKAIGGKLTEQTLFTEFEALIGTPAYMSPEQAGMSDLDIDTRSDVYSLGVLLYELLTGTTPFDERTLQRASQDEIRRIIREVEPLKPSTRVSRLLTEPLPSRNRCKVDRSLKRSLRHYGPDLASIACHRGVDPRSLGRLLHGEIDWIVMKCLEKDRARRYETAAALAMDISRYLVGDSVVAMPSTQLYRLRKLVRRNRTAFLVAAVLVALLVSGTTVSTTLWWRAERQTKEAHEVARFMEDTLASVDPEFASQLDTKLLKKLLDDAAARINGGDLAAAPQAERRLRSTIGRVYAAIAEYKSAHGMLDPLEHLAMSSDQRLDYLVTIAYLSHFEGKPGEALKRNEDALTICRSLHPGDNGDMVNLLYDHAQYLYFTCQYEKALLQARNALSMAQRIYPSNHPVVLQGRRREATALEFVGRPAEAMEAFERLLSDSRQGSDRILYACALAGVGGCYQDLDRPQEALPKYEETLAIMRRHYPGDHPFLIVSMNDLAFCLLDLGIVDQAISWFSSALEMSRRVYTPPHPQIAKQAGYMAEAMRRAHRLSEAEAYAQEGVAMFQSNLDWDLSTGGFVVNWYLANVLQDAGKPSEAITVLRNLVSFVDKGGEQHADATVYCLNLLGLTLLQQMDLETTAEAEDILRRSLEICSKHGPDGRVRMGLQDNAKSVLGEALRIQAKYAEAESLLLDGYAGLTAHGSGTAPKGFGIAFHMAALRRIVALYDAWHAAEPERGYDAKAAEWRAKLAQARQP